MWFLNNQRLLVDNTRHIMRIRKELEWLVYERVRARVFSKSEIAKNEFDENSRYRKNAEETKGIPKEIK